MIHYQLRCSDDHTFDGWFRNSAAFDTQVGQGLVSCPVCGDTSVNRALMAPRIARSPATVEAAGPAAAPAKQRGMTPPGAVPAGAPTGAALPDHVRSMLQRLRAEVEKTCDYVGPGFAEEARAIHRGDRDSRPIYGESTPEQAEALADEGIEVARIPWVPRADG